MQKMTNYVDCSYNMCCSEGVNGTVTDPLPCKGGNSTGQITNKICSGVSRRGKEFESWRVGVSASRTWWTWWTGVGVRVWVCVRSSVTHTHTHTHTSFTHNTHIYIPPPPLDLRRPSWRRLSSVARNWSTAATVVRRTRRGSTVFSLATSALSPPLPSVSVSFSFLR